MLRLRGDVSQAHRSRPRARDRIPQREDEMTNNVLDQIVFGHPQEDLHGAPDANERSVEIRVERYAVKRDHKDGPRRVDLALTLAQDQHQKLLEHLTRHADDAKVEFVVDLRTMPNGIMPPDPLGPAALAAFNFASAMNPSASGRQNADALTAADYLQIATTLLTQVKAGFSFGPTYIQGESFYIPPIGNVPSTGNARLDVVLGTLIAAVNGVGATMADQPFDPSNKPDQLAALLEMHGAVERAFS
ncbi:MAG TPA: hypothetical protein VIW69_16635 [Candidatus Elarobacter sp.]